MKTRGQLQNNRIEKLNNNNIQKRKKNYFLRLVFTIYKYMYIYIVLQEKTKKKGEGRQKYISPSIFSQTVIQNYPKLYLHAINCIPHQDPQSCSRTQRKNLVWCKPTHARILYVCKKRKRENASMSTKSHMKMSVSSRFHSDESGVTF